MMDPDMLKIEEVVIGETSVDTPAEMATSEQYTTLIIQEPPAAPIIQPYQHDNLQCFQCFITFCNSKAKERHMKKSHREEYKQQLQQCDTLFTCYVCDRTFLSSEELTQHQGSHNKEDKPFKCPHCQESFRTFSELTSHRRHVCPERQFLCRDCGESFRGQALLRSHRLSQHPPRPEGDPKGDDGTKTHRCGKCGRGFETEAELLQHQENHAGDQHCNGRAPPKRKGRPPKTEEAADGDKKVKRRKKVGEGASAEESTMSNHAEVPAPGAPETKGRGLGRRGRPPKAIQSAAVEQSPEQAEDKNQQVAMSLHQHACPDCQQFFPSLTQLRVHKKEKHSRPAAPRKAHGCGECEESFARPEQLEAHMARVHCAGRYACPTCGKSFGRESNLKAHRQTHAEEGKAADSGKR